MQFKTGEDHPWYSAGGGVAEQRPIEQNCPAGHVTPQAPQFAVVMIDTSHPVDAAPSQSA